jgi:cellulose biosynthesis protein BcsQ
MRTLCRLDIIAPNAKCAADELLAVVFPTKKSLVGLAMPTHILETQSRIPAYLQSPRQAKLCACQLR